MQSSLSQARNSRFEERKCVPPFPCTIGLRCFLLNNRAMWRRLCSWLETYIDITVDMDELDLTSSEQYANEEIGGDTYVQKMMELTTSAQNED